MYENRKFVYDIILDCSPSTLDKEKLRQLGSLQKFFMSGENSKDEIHKKFYEKITDNIKIKGKFSSSRQLNNVYANIFLALPLENSSNQLTSPQLADYISMTLKKYGLNNANIFIISCSSYNQQNLSKSLAPFSNGIADNLIREKYNNFKMYCYHAALDLDNGTSESDSTISAGRHKLEQIDGQINKITQKFANKEITTGNTFILANLKRMLESVLYNLFQLHKDNALDWLASQIELPIKHEIMSKVINAKNNTSENASSVFNYSLRLQQLEKYNHILWKELLQNNKSLVNELWVKRLTPQQLCSDKNIDLVNQQFVAIAEDTAHLYFKIDHLVKQKTDLLLWQAFFDNLDLLNLLIQRAVAEIYLEYNQVLLSAKKIQESVKIFANNGKKLLV